jgi:two-component system, NarL family, response regulator FusR
MKTSARPTLSRKGVAVQTTPQTYRGPASAVGDALPGRARIVLIDDDWGALSRSRKIIEQNPDLRVVAACRCADGAMAAVQQYRPAMVILDVQLPDRDGFELVHDITAISEAKVIVFTAALQKAEIVTALRSGAKAIVFKDQPASMLISCMRRVLAGEACIVQNLTVRQRPCTPVSRSVEALSERELEVAQWAAAGARNKEIAWDLGISEGTVKLHLFHAYRKLRVSNRVGLVLALHRAASKTLVVITFVSLTFV